jgi:hypothetical protein
MDSVERVEPRKCTPLCDPYHIKLELGRIERIYYAGVPDMQFLRGQMTLDAKERRIDDHSPAGSPQAEKAPLSFGILYLSFC